VKPFDNLDCPCCTTSRIGTGFGVASDFGARRPAPAFGVGRVAFCAVAAARGALT
jgi:hypothetical protein